MTQRSHDLELCAVCEEPAPEFDTCEACHQFVCIKCQHDDPPIICVVCLPTKENKGEGK